MSIKKCPNAACASIATPAAKFQTEKYGPGMRVHNPTKPGDVSCTICGTKSK